MNKTFLIFRHEFLHTLRRKGFIIMTPIVPFLALLAVGILHFTSKIQKPATSTKVNIGYMDETGGFRQYTHQGDIVLVRFDKVQDATSALIGGVIQEYFIIPPDYISRGVIKMYTIQRELQPPDRTMAAISNFLLSNLLAGKVPPATLKRAQNPLNLVTTTLTKAGDVATQQGGYGNLIVVGAFSLLLALSMVFSSAYMIQGMGEEKENRLMEILVSSVSTRQLLTGKVLGLGAAGLVQVAVWVLSLPLVFNLAVSAAGGYGSLIKVPTSFLVLGTAYFILGYLLFVVLAASVGAVSPTTQEAQQLSAIYTIFALVPIWLMGLVVAYPDSPVWVILTIFPFTAPVLGMLRLGLTNVPAWQLGASMAVLALSVIGGLSLSARVFSAYLLMYGKRPTLREVMRSLKNG